MFYNILKVIFITLFFSFNSFAQTPGYYAKLIDEGKCAQVLSELPNEMKDSNKRSDLFDLLMIEASFCEGKINAHNKNEVLKIIKKIEKENPLLVGINSTELNQLKEKINNIEKQDNQNIEESSIISEIFLIVVLIFIALGFAFIYLTQNNNITRTKVKSYMNDDNLEKTNLMSEINQLILKVENRKDKLRFEDNESLLRKMNKFSDSLNKIKDNLEKATLNSEITAVKNSFNNLKVLIKVA